MEKKKREKITRQDWQPNLFLRTLRTIWMVLFSLVKIAAGAAITVLFIGIVCCFVVVGAVGDYLQQDVLPEISVDLTEMDVDQTSFVYYVDSNGDIQQMQQIYTSTNRQWASIDEIPDGLIHAAVAIEDKRFYEHQGVDWITTVKACANMFFGSNSTFGGSTITQQMLKNYTGKDEVTVQRKVQEIFKAQKCEMEYDKDDIMEVYLNLIYLGEGCYGVKSAAWKYFAKELDELTIAECASLISITNNPSLYDPYISERCRERNKERQLNVLWEMYDQGWITREEYDEAKVQELVFESGNDAETKTDHTCANCGYTNTASRYNREGDVFTCPECGTVADIVLDETSDIYSWATELVLDDVAEAMAEQQGLEWNSQNKSILLEQIKRGGYHIYSTIDMDVQAVVDEVYTNLENIPNTRSSQQLQSAIVVIDNRTGDIVAVAGGVGEKTVFDAFSHATDEGKQTGSAMKPLTCYAPAFELGVISPATVLADLPLTYDNGAFPLNESRSYRISTSVLTGVASSINTIAVRTLDQIGTRYGFDFATEKFRLNLLESQTLDSGRELTDIGYAPLGLGALTYGLTVREMAEGYATFPNDGVYREGRTFTKVYDSNGNLILDNTQETEQVMGKKAVDYMNYCLRAVVTQGTAYYANLSTTETAGKTGTSDNNQDRWFVGYTDYYTAAVWCGYKIPEEVRLTDTSTNPSGALWVKVMKELHEDVQWRSVSDTSNMGYVTICLDSGDIATDACNADPRGNRTQSVRVYYEDMPDSYCKKHTMVEYCSSGDGVANEFCEASGATLVKKGLVKYTQDEIDEIRKAGYTVYNFTDDIIYLVDSNGGDKAFYGIDGNINKKVQAPYKVCTVHTAETAAPTEPSEPSEPSEPTETEAPNP